MLFLLFVAGEHLDPEVHRALHARTKATVTAPDSRKAGEKEAGAPRVGITR
jgi:hypothetical protein